MKRAAIFALCAALLITPVCAYGEIAAAFSIEDVTQALPESAVSALGGEAESDFTAGVKKILEYIMVNLKSEIQAVLAPLVKVLAIVVLASISSAALGSKNGIDYVNLAAAVAIAVISVGDVSSLIRMGEDTMEEVMEFSQTLLPVLTTAAAASGALTSSGAKYLASSMFLDVLMSLARNVILPLIGAYTACIVASSALADSRLGAACAFMKWLCTFLLTSLVSVFTAYLSISGIVASSTDAAAARAAKSAISTFIPVVGNIISSASGALVGGAGVIRASIGVVGLLGVAGVCALPFLRLGIRYVLFRAASAAAQSLASPRLGLLVSGIAKAYGMIMALVGSQAVFLYISIISMIKAVTG